MKFRILAITAMVVLLWAAAAIVGASEQAAGKDSTGQASPVAAVEKPAAVLPELNYAFDPVVDGTQITHDFAIKNVGDGPLSITQVKTG